MDQYRLHRIAGRGVLFFRVDEDRNGFFEVRVLIDENVAYSAGMSHDRDLCVLHDITHKAVGAARNDEIDLFVAF